MVPTELEKRIHDFVCHEVSFDDAPMTFDSNPTWARTRELGTQLWLDTGSLDESAELWTPEFQALTTNNTLLNNEVQKGIYDDLIGRACGILDDFDLGEQDRVLEIAFILNAVHGLRLVKRYDSFVSVEEHTDIAHDLERAVRVGLRYHAICPERFIVKLPFTPAGVLATRRLVAEGVRINHTLNFSARQNYVIARLAKPAYVNVFLGRLNAFVADNGLGSGDSVGEKSIMASQAVLKGFRDAGISDTRQIGASLRNGGQVRDLVGVDVLTMPPKAAKAFLELGMDPAALSDRTAHDYQPDVDPSVDWDAVGLNTLWDVDEEIVACVEALEKEDLDAMTADALVTYFHDHDAADFFVRWSDEEIKVSAEEGKIPKLDHWTQLLSSGSIGLDALMNLAGLNAFIGDQREMDARVRDNMKAAL